MDPTARSNSAGASVMVPLAVAASYGESTAGSTTTSAPQRFARARRPGEKSLATMVFTPRALRWQMTARPSGPQPMTTAVSRREMSLRRTACNATAMGSVSAATSIDRPLGMANVIDASASVCSA